MHESFLVYGRFRYLKFALGLAALSIAIYALHDPVEPPNGGTWLGYTLGTIGAALILWLLWFGVRKRQYHSSFGQVAGWLSAHVYLGSALLVVATLHTGFQFDWNVHLLSYVLTVLVIVSGLVGVYTYVRYPALLTQNRAGMSAEAMLAEIVDLDRQCLQIADQMGEEVHKMILRSIERTSFSGNLWLDPLRRMGMAFGDVASELNAFRSLAPQQVPAAPPPALAAKEATVFFVAEQLGNVRSAAQAEQVHRLLDLITSKKALVTRVQQDIRYHALMKVWLYLHVPLSIALLAALTVHVISVFFYW
jgi:hypothetical protein